jgi:hypothetical protein
MNWRYGVAEYWFEDAKTGKTDVDRAEIIEVYDLQEHGRAWSDAGNTLSDNAGTMPEILARIANDVAGLKGKADIIVILDSRTWKDKCWWWADKPEEVHDVTEGNDAEDEGGGELA